MKASIYYDRNYKIGKTDKRLFGSFVEHMGRVIYSGIYEPENPCADEEGFRTDVIRAAREMGVSTVRYPGGNFVSAYHWEDGIGPKEKRPRKLDLAWKSIETNEFGTHEFMKWADRAEVEPIFTVNLGTRGIEAATEYLEYCNFPGGSHLSEKRKDNGQEEPFQVKLWCLGNEMDGKWQLGHKTADEYGRLAEETGKAMKLIDPDIELIVCGSSLASMESCPEWDLKVLDATYDIVDYLALHQYYGGQERGALSFLAQSQEFEEHIGTIRSVVNVVKKMHHSDKQIWLSVDEWGVWSCPGDTVNQEIDQRPWQIAPAISEQVYTLEDTLLFAEMQMAILRNADMIRIACQSLLTNISACIMTVKGKGLWLQPIYYPFAMMANHAKECVVIKSMTETEEYVTDRGMSVPFLDQLIVYNDEKKEIVIFLVNRCENESMNVVIRNETDRYEEVLEFISLCAEDKKMTNQKDHHAITPQINEKVSLSKKQISCEISSLSFNMLRIRIAD